MLQHFSRLLIRRDAAPSSPPNTMVILLAVLLVLLIVALLLVAGLLYMRYRRRVRKQQETSPPEYDEEKRMSSVSTTSSHRRFMTRPSESVCTHSEKQNLINDTESPLPSAVPEIHITFPEEIDASGKRTSGRVVVVRVGDNGVGLEPVDGLPAYQQDDKRFESLDLERIGGLIEKARNAPSYDKFEKA